MDGFDYNQAFSRNIGWLSLKEQQSLKEKTVAIGGMGGVGGYYLIVLCRLGVERFKIADPDTFDLSNFNRQAGAMLSTLSQPKSEVLVKMAKDINPNVNITVFNKVEENNVDTFLSNCDLCIDGMDFFSIIAREKLFFTAHKLKIPVITAVPLGMGSCHLIFNQHGMSYMDYFQWQGKSEKEKIINFAIGIAPKPVYLSYLVDKSNVDFEKQRGPSTAMACMLCGGVVGVEALKTLLNRGKIYSAPYYHLFDPYLGKYKRGYLVGGNRNPIQYFKKLWINKLLSSNNHTN